MGGKMTNLHTRGKSLIGKGTFSRVYDNLDGTVTILSDCQVKECFSFGWGNDSELFPKIQRIDYLDSGEGVYVMKKYDRVRAIKPNISQHQYALYQWLRANTTFHNDNNHDNYDTLYNIFSDMPGEFEQESQNLLECLDALTNYGTNMKFEISPRNIAIDDGKLVLLDCFFFVSALKKKYRQGKKL